MKHYEKGCFGYRNYHKRTEIGKVAFGAAMIAAQLIAREFIETAAWKNILTVMAIMSVLPTANAASPLIAAWRYRTPCKAFHDRVLPYENRFTILYDLIITSKDAIMPMDAVAVHPTGVYAYCTAQKLDTAKAERFFREMFTGHKLEPNMKILMDEQAFFHRLDTLKPSEAYEDDGSVGYTAQLLKSLSM